MPRPLILRLVPVLALVALALAPAPGATEDGAERRAALSVFGAGLADLCGGGAGQAGPCPVCCLFPATLPPGPAEARAARAAAARQGLPRPVRRRAAFRDPGHGPRAPPA